MLIEFRVENHRSLREEQALTMEAGRVGAVHDPRLRSLPGHAESLLTVAGLYGANASGKSNVLSALAFMREAVLLSHRAWAPNDEIPRDPFAWGESRAMPSMFEVTLLISGVRYQYGFLAHDFCFQEEWLFAWPHGKKQIWFEREGNVFKFGEKLKGENKRIEEITRPNALFLSAAIQHKHQQLEPIFNWFKHIQAVHLSDRQFHSTRSRLSPNALARLLEEIEFGLTQPESIGTPNLSGDFLEYCRLLLGNADTGIFDIRMRGKQLAERTSLTRNSSIELKHLENSDDSWLSLDQESSGTQTLFRMAWPIWQSISTGSLLLVDELEASLHPKLAEAIVRQFNDPATNPRHAQLIFTTHDTNLLGTTLGDAVLRRDQVWLTEKDQTGATVLYPVTDYKPRKDENLERGYLQGRFGAIPFLGDFTLMAE